LPPKAREAARQWPRAAYEAQAESFALYWRAETQNESRLACYMGQLDSSLALARDAGRAAAACPRRQWRR
jgi:hypothetical protein